MRGSDETGTGILSRGQIERLIDVSRLIFAELDLDLLLETVVSTARDLTGARYAAVGVLDEEGEGLKRFIFLGIDEEARRRIGPLPEGHGVLGELIANDAGPLRLEDLTAHPRSYGFPAGHPEMKSFLGVPIKVREEGWGNLYLTEKAGGQPFTESDERLVTILAEWTSVAVENADLHAAVKLRREELERAVRALETSTALARAGAAGMRPEQLQQLAAKRGRDLARSRQFLLLLAGEGQDLVVTAAAGEGELSGLEGSVVDARLGFIAEVLDQASPVNLDLPEGGLPGLESEAALSGPAMLAALRFRGDRSGMIIALGPLGRSQFEPGDERLFESFATSVATTLVAAWAAESDKLRMALDASEGERRRWARELHDETLQELGALQVMIDSAQASDSTVKAREMLDRASRHVERSISHLQETITELRPSALDELGVGPAVESLVERVAEVTDLAIDAEVDLGNGGAGGRLDPELESTLYRLTQESLNNVIKHARASAVRLRLSRNGDRVELELEDDGCGFDPASVGCGFGLVGMRERVGLVGGRLSIDSSPGNGTRIEAVLPARA